MSDFILTLIFRLLGVPVHYHEIVWLFDSLIRITFFWDGGLIFS